MNNNPSAEESLTPGEERDENDDWIKLLMTEHYSYFVRFILETQVEVPDATNPAGFHQPTLPLVSRMFGEGFSKLIPTISKTDFQSREP